MFPYSSLNFPAGQNLILCDTHKSIIFEGTAMNSALFP